MKLTGIFRFFFMLFFAAMFFIWSWWAAYGAFQWAGTSMVVWLTVVSAGLLMIGGFWTYHAMCWLYQKLKD